MTATLPRSGRLEAIRAIAALAVLVCHAYAQAHGFVFDTYWKRVVLGGGLYGVYVFFALSGYLLYLPFARRDVGEGADVDLRRYARNRALRIFPLYYVVLVVLLVVNGAERGVALRFLTFTQNFREDLVAKAVDGPMWSLVVELHFYALLPLLAAGIARVARGSAGRAAVVLVALGVVATAVDVADPRPVEPWTYSLPSTFQFFAAGMLVALVHARADVARPRWLDHRLARADLWIAASLPLWAVVFWDYDAAPVATAACGLLVAAGALPVRRGRLDAFLEWRALALIGLVSYGIYLWHVPVLHWLDRRGALGDDAGFPGLAAAGLAASVLLATVTWKLVEAPAMRLRNRPLGWLQPWRTWGPVALVALAARGVLAVATWPPALGADAADYDRLGRLLATTGSFGDSVLAAGGGPTAFRPPLYPAFLGGVYRATGGSLGAARLAQLLLGAVAVVLIGLLAERVWDRRTGLVAGVLAAVYPPLVAASVAPMSESLFVPLEAAALLAAVEARRSAGRSGWWLAGAAGAACGLGVLTRPAGVVLVPVVALLAWPSGARRALVAVAAAVAVVVPWSVAASVDLGTPVPVSTIDGFNLAGVYAAEVAGDPAHPAVWRPPSAVADHAPLFADRSLDEGELARALRDAGTTYAADHPGYVAEVAARSTARLLDLEGPGLTRDVYRLDYSIAEGAVGDLAFASWWALVPFVAAGVALGAHRRMPLALLVAPVLLVAVTVPVLGHARLRAPIEPFAVLLAAVAVRELLVRVSAWRRPSAPVVASRTVAGTSGTPV